VATFPFAGLVVRVHEVTQVGDVAVVPVPAAVGGAEFVFRECDRVGEAGDQGSVPADKDGIPVAVGFECVVSGTPAFFIQLWARFRAAGLA